MSKCTNKASSTVHLTKIRQTNERTRKYPLHSGKISFIKIKIQHDCANLVERERERKRPRKDRAYIHIYHLKKDLPRGKRAFGLARVNCRSESIVWRRRASSQGPELLIFLNESHRIISSPVRDPRVKSQPLPARETIEKTRGPFTTPSCFVAPLTTKDHQFRLSTCCYLRVVLVLLLSMRKGPVTGSSPVFQRIFRLG